jgi:chromosome transmission fidelity protein 1
VGLPYPDGRDILLQEKLKYANSKECGSGKKLYEAMCMKVVNQSIGRSIRHINDYSSILLIDKRYTNDRINSQLPNWIKQSLTSCTTFSQTKYELQQFFLNKNN